VITGKVARILSDEEIILNVGSDDGVKEDMEFVIFSESDHVYDPETGADLGAIETVKGRVKIYHVQDQMSRARTLTYQTSVPSPTQVFLRPFVSSIGPQVELRRRKLEVPEREVSPLDEDLVVRVGDKARSV
jgi:hypothetical protein